LECYCTVVISLCVLLTVRPVRYTDQGAFSTSHYHISNAVVERASAEEVVCCFKTSQLSLHSANWFTIDILYIQVWYILFITRWRCVSKKF